MLILKNSNNRKTITSKLTRERALELLTYDPIIGNLYNRVSRYGVKAGTMAGTISNGYWHVQIDYTIYKAHRLIWFMQSDSWPENIIDHIDGNGLNNAWKNLREATYSENAQNRGPSKRNTSGKVGVHPIKANGLWGAEIRAHNKKINLGCFECKDEAIAARCEAEKHYFGDFAWRVADV